MDLKAKQFTETLKEVLAKWKEGHVIWTAELGGMGPGYEQAIQVLLFTICEKWGDRPAPTDNGMVFPAEFEFAAKDAIEELKAWGFSGAQVGAAKTTAYQFLKFGYSEMMNKLPDDRRIMVTNSLVPRES